MISLAQVDLLKRVLSVIGALVCVTSSVVAQGSVVTAEPGTLTVRTGARTVELSAADLAQLARVRLRIPGEAPGDSVTMAGVRLWDVLQRVSVPAAEASGRQRAVMSVVLRGRDGQRAVIALVEVDPSFSSGAIVLAESRDGRPLDAVEGAWRAIIPSDRRHARWIRDVVDIEIVALP